MGRSSPSLPFASGFDRAILTKVGKSIERPKCLCADQVIE